MSTMFLRTLREDPADADVVSDKLLQRACYLRKVYDVVISDGSRKLV